MQQETNVVVKQSCHSRGMLSGISHILGCCRYKMSVLPNLIWNLQRLSLLFINNLRGRSRIKYGMTSLYNNAGFTLIELLVVVLIIGILAAVAVPQYQKAVEKSRVTQAYTLLSSIYPAQRTYYWANGSFTKDLKELDVDFPYDDGGNTTYEFDGGGFTWRKCTDGGCLSARKAYKGGTYGLQIRFDEDDENVNTGEIVCYATTAGSAVEICQGLGYNTAYYTGTFSSAIGEVTFYKK